MRERAAGDSTLEVVDDQIGSPTYVGDLADALLTLVESWPGARVLHAANGGTASRYEQACAVFTALGADPERVRPVSSAAHPRPAARPGYSALSGIESARAGLAPLRPWRDALAASLAR
jgi:dTDP-4-dehydrorhamnose reductase